MWYWKALRVTVVLIATFFALKYCYYLINYPSDAVFGLGMLGVLTTIALTIKALTYKRNPKEEQEYEQTSESGTTKSEITGSDNPEQRGSGAPTSDSTNCTDVKL